MIGRSRSCWQGGGGPHEVEFLRFGDSTLAAWALGTKLETIIDGVVHASSPRTMKPIRVKELISSWRSAGPRSFEPRGQAHSAQPGSARGSVPSSVLAARQQREGLRTNRQHKQNEHRPCLPV